MTPDEHMIRIPGNTIQKAAKDWHHLTCKDGNIVHYGGGPERQAQTAKDEAEEKEYRKAHPRIRKPRRKKAKK